MNDRASLPPSQPADDLVVANEQLVLAMLRATAEAEAAEIRLGEVTRSSHLDALTGLPDRLLFFDRFSQAITHARRHGSRLGALFVDLDRFKVINDTLGHAFGDLVLRGAAQALVSTVREADTVSRHGGDEFLILLTEISTRNGAEIIARKLCDAVAASPAIAELGVQLTASIGVCVYPDDGHDVRTLVDRADAAMYRAKKARTGVALYAREDQWSTHREASLQGSFGPEAGPHPSPSPIGGDGLYLQLREANERLLIAALDAQAVQTDGGGRTHPFRALMEHMENGAISVDADGSLLYCNRRFADLIDIDGSELVGTPFSSFFTTVAEGQAFRTLLTSAPTACASGNFVLRNADGTGVPVNITLVDEEARAATGPARVISGIVTDLRQDGPHDDAVAALTRSLRRAVIAQGRAERRLKLALDAAGMGGLEVDLESGMLGWTRRHDRIFGRVRAPNRETLSDLFEQVLPEDRALVERAFADAANNGTIDVEHRIRRADTGAIRWIHIKAMAPGDAGRRGRAVGVVADVTERRAVADQLRQAQKMEAVGRLTSGIAHDFNNLLMVIGGSIDVLARRIAVDERTDHALASARNAVLRGAKLNQQLLSFSRKHELHPEVLSLDDLVPAFVDLAERAAGESIALRVERLPDVWPCRGDRNLLEVAVLNLAINARDAMPDGGVLTLSIMNVTADVHAATPWGANEGEYAAVRLEDTGTGMPPDVVLHAFEPFFTTKAAGLGTGLGLSQVHGMAKQLGGFISIESTLGIGTRITIHLPRHP